MEKLIQVDGVDMIYRAIGSGTPVVLLHGFCTYSHIWDPVLMMLDDELRLLIPDLPGFGSSDPVPNISMEGYARRIWKMLDQEGIEKAIVFGHSMGGYIALQMHAEHPDRIAGLGLIHSHVYADTDEKKAGRMKAVDFIDANGAFAYVKNFVPGLFSTTTDRLIVKAVIASLEEQDALGLQAAQMAMSTRSDHQKVLIESSIPVLFVFGKNDQLMPLEQLLEQTALPAVADVYVLPHSGHMGMLEQPGEMARAMNSYLAMLPTT
jgi:pimeloyl-ACP methyl ester carboxylesterase